MPRNPNLKQQLDDFRRTYVPAGRDLGPSTGPRMHGPHVGPLRDMNLGLGSGGGGSTKISGRATRLPSHLINLGTGRPKSDEYMDAYTTGTAQDTVGGGGGGGGLESYTDEATDFFDSLPWWALPLGIGVAVYLYTKKK